MAHPPASAGHFGWKYFAPEPMSLSPTFLVMTCLVPRRSGGPPRRYAASMGTLPADFRRAPAGALECPITKRPRSPTGGQLRAVR